MKSDVDLVRRLSTRLCNDNGKDSLIGHLGIELVEAGDDSLNVRMLVDNRTRTTAGVLHGGASVTVAETLATWAAAFCVDPAKHHYVGLEINATPSRRGGRLRLRRGARPVHLGKTTHVWEGSVDRRQRQAGLYLTPHRGGPELAQEVLGKCAIEKRL